MFTEKAFAGCAVNSKSELLLNGGYVPPGGYSIDFGHIRHDFGAKNCTKTGPKVGPETRPNLLNSLPSPGSYSDSTWYTGDGESFSALPPMPIQLSFHCAVALENDDIFVTGGSVPNTGIDSVRPGGGSIVVAEWVPYLQKSLKVSV